MRPQLQISRKEVTITEFIARVLRTLDRPVIDRTGLAGRFDIHFEFASTESLDAGEAACRNALAVKS